ncbi:hypothetical protein, partial [Mycobacteroides abscessus]
PLLTGEEFRRAHLGTFDERDHQMTEESYQVGGHSSTSPPRTASASGQTSSTSTDLGVVALATGDWT